MDSTVQNTAVRRVFIVIALLAIGLLATICFAPLIPQFFSQDDFGFIKIGIEQAGEKFWNYLKPTPGRFRPLGNVTYFMVAYRIFGFNPIPYHITSLLLHLCNSLLVYLLLRKLKISQAPAIVTTGLFALNVAFFHAIGWISCAKQLQASLFMLLSIYFALGALYEYSAKKQVLSALAYLISIMNMEQAVLTPVVIFLMSFLRVRGIRLSFAGTVKTVWPHFLILGVYGAFILFWKGLPTEGVSRFEYGTNVVHNIIVYLGATYDFWPILSNFIPNLGFDLVPSHLILAAFVIYLIIGRSFRELAFALVFLFFMLLPMLFLYGHFFYYHMYIASFGPLFLLALVLEDLLIPLKRQGLNTPQRRLLAACILVLAVAPFSYFKIRENISLALNEETRMQGSFVLRRSVFARNIFDNLEKKSGDMNNVRNIHMVHIKPGLDRIKPGDTEIRVGGLDREMYWALARGNVARVYFHKYDVDVTMESDFDPDAYQKGPDGRTRVFFYDEYGGIYTPEELMKTLEKYKAQYGGDQPGITVKSYQGKDEIEE